MSQLEKILIVEDEPVLRGNLQMFLERLGFDVIEAGHGAEGLDKCIRERPDLVLLDINIPGRNGFEVCRSIKEDPVLRDTPVIFISGMMDTRIKLEAFASGGVDYVSKPFHLEEVEARVRSHLEIRRQRRQIQESHQHLREALAEAHGANLLLIDLNERLRQSEELKSHFIANMRNEINDPLGSILGLAEEIIDPRLPLEPVRILAGLIKSEASHLDFHLRNIFCAAELEAGEASPSISKVDVGSVLRDVAESFSGRASIKEQKVVVQVSEDSSPFATDAGKLRIILANLLANAIEFSPNGGRIELRALRRNGGLILEVEDQGPGLSVAERSLLFARFKQLDSGPARAHKGQGLGLAVVKALAELLDGEILVDSEPGRGSRFTCRLPESTRLQATDTTAFDGNLFIFDEPCEL